MNSNVVEDIIKRSNMRLSLFSIGGIALVLVGVLLSANYLINFINGPFVTDKTEVLSYTDAGQISHYFVSLRGDDVFDTGYEYVSTSGSGSDTVEHSYAALLLDDRLLLVETQGASTEFPLEFTGALVPISGELQNDVIRALELEVPEIEGAFLPFMLETEDFRSKGLMGLVVGAIVLLFSVLGIGRAVIRGSDPTRHPIMRALTRFGDPLSVAEQIDMELSQPHEENGSVHLTRHWLIHKTDTNLQATRLIDIIWIYKQVTQHRTNGIPTGKTFTALLWDRYNICISIPLKNEAAVHDMLAIIAQQAPWVVVGFDEDLNQNWKQDRDSFIAAVDQRRKGPLPQN